MKHTHTHTHTHTHIYIYMNASFEVEWWIVEEGRGTHLIGTFETSFSKLRQALYLGSDGVLQPRPPQTSALWRDCHAKKDWDEGRNDTEKEIHWQRWAQKGEKKGRETKSHKQGKNDECSKKKKKKKNKKKILPPSEIDLLIHLQATKRIFQFDTTSKLPWVGERRLIQIRRGRERGEKLRGIERSSRRTGRARRRFSFARKLRKPIGLWDLRCRSYRDRKAVEDALVTRRQRGIIMQPAILGLHHEALAATQSTRRHLVWQVTWRGTGHLYTCGSLPHGQRRLEYGTGCSSRESLTFPPLFLFLSLYTYLYFERKAMSRA